MKEPEQKTILVVDDEHALMRLIEVNLTRQGYRVVTAQSAAEAVERVVADPPHLMVVDFTLPGTDGIALIDEIRVERRIRRAPAILLLPEKKMDEGKRLTGAFDCYITKPFNPMELIAHARRILRSIDGDPRAGDVILYGP